MSSRSWRNFIDSPQFTEQQFPPSCEASFDLDGREGSCQSGDFTWLVSGCQTEYSDPSMVPLSDQPSRIKVGN